MHCILVRQLSDFPWGMWSCGTQPRDSIKNYLGSMATSALESVCELQSWSYQTDLEDSRWIQISPGQVSLFKFKCVQVSLGQFSGSMGTADWWNYVFVVVSQRVKSSDQRKWVSWMSTCVNKWAQDAGMCCSFYPSNKVIYLQGQRANVLIHCEFSSIAAFLALQSKQFSMNTSLRHAWEQGIESYGMP